MEQTPKSWYSIFPETDPDRDLRFDDKHSTARVWHVKRFESELSAASADCLSGAKRFTCRARAAEHLASALSFRS
jgi:hypothetical protein